MKQNRFPNAVATWRKALELDSDDARAHYNLGYALSEGGDVKSAIAEFRQLDAG